MTNLVRRISETYPTSATITNGTVVGGLAPSSVVVEDWGTLRIVAGETWINGTATAGTASTGTDVTTVRGVRTLIDSLTFTEPYGEGVGQLTFPAVTEYDYPSHTDLGWLLTGSNIDIYHTLGSVAAAAAGTAEVPYWHGFITSLEFASAPGVSTPVSVQLLGALAGEASLRAHQPIMSSTAVDVGTSIGRALSPELYARPLPGFRFDYDSDTTTIDTVHRGSRGQSVLDYLDEMLGLAQTASTCWTISRSFTTDYPTAPRAYYLREKSVVQTSTVYMGARGVSFTLNQSADEHENAIYGEGLDADGSRWRNAKYPMLTPSVPANPSRVSGSTYPIGAGDTDALFTADIITELQFQLRAGGWPDVTITGTWDANTTSAIEALFEDVTGTLQSTLTSNSDWATVWSSGTGYTDLSSGYFRPLAEVSESQPYLFSANGDVTGSNPDFDHRLRVERVISFSDGISKSRARTYARRLLRNASQTYGLWTGTVTLTMDPEERSRLDIREGGYINLVTPDGYGTYLYIAGITIGFETEGCPVTLTVSRTDFDLSDLSARIDRDREAKTDPAKAFYALRNRPARPFRSVVGWDKESGAGIIQPTTLTANQWNVMRFVGSERGSIGAISATTSGTACAFAIAMFGGSVSTSSIAAVVSNPLGTVAGGYDSHWAIPANGSALEAMSFIEAWGSYGEAAGYWPGAQSVGTALNAGTVTGRMVDSLAWDFVSADPPFLWAAVYPTSNCTFKATARILIEE